MKVEGKLAVYALWISANSYFNYSKIDAAKGLRPATAPAGLHNAGCTADCFAVIASLISSPRLFLAVCTGLLASALAGCARLPEAMPGLEQRRRVYPLCIGCTAVQSIAAALPLGALSALANALPLAALGFGWVLPAAAGLLAGILLSRTEK